MSIREKTEAKIAEFAGEAIAYNDTLAENPEISAQEYNSSRLAAEILSRHGFEVEYPLAGVPTAFRGIKKGRAAGRKVALLMEYDALPGVGHACGHCASGAMSLLAGLALAALSAEFDGEVHVIGTPDEEVGGGKIPLSDAGVFDGYACAVMIHLTSVNTEIWPEFMALSNLSMKFHGLSSHAAAAPWDGRNALNGVTLAMHAIDMLRQHVTPDIRIHGVIRQGGDAMNIVPDYAEAEFYVRGNSMKQVELVEGKVINCAKGAALATETTVEFDHPSPALFDLKPNRSFKKLLDGVLEELNIETPPFDGPPFQGSSDIGHVSIKCPTAHPMLAVMEHAAALHTKEFGAAMTSESVHNGIVTGARIIALSVLKVLESEELAEAIRKDFMRS